MIKNWQILNRLTQTLLTVSFLILCGATQILSQEITPNQNPDSAKISRMIPSAQNDDDECSRLLDKTLDAYEKLKIAKADVDSELVTNKNLRAKEEIYNQELLKAVALLTSSEKRSKSFFEKLQKQLEKVLAAATDPKNLITIVSLIVLTKELRK